MIEDEILIKHNKAMNKEKQLPKEVVEKIQVGMPYVTGLQQKGAKIAQSHYEPIIDGLREENQKLKAENFKLKSQVSVDGIHLKEKDATIAKLMGLLEGSVKRNIKNLIQDGRQPSAFVEKAQNVEWESFRIEHKLNNLPQ